MNPLQQKKLFLLDMDGTIYLENELFDGTKEFLNHVRQIGGRYLFLTNNSSKSVDKYIEKLASMGIASTAEDYVTSVNATVSYLEKKAYHKIYVSGTKSFYQQLADAGLPVTDRIEDGIDCICMGFDTELTFQKLENICILLNRDVDYVATNPDWVCPTSYGFVPDCGSVSEMIFNATKKRPLFIGKPRPAMVELALEKTGFSKEEAVVIGDRLYTDIACGVNAGISSIFVLSGEGTMDDLEQSEVKPEFVYDNIRSILADLQKSEA